MDLQFIVLSITLLFQSVSAYASPYQYECISLGDQTRLSWMTSTAGPLEMRPIAIQITKLRGKELAENANFNVTVPDSQANERAQFSASGSIEGHEYSLFVSSVQPKSAGSAIILTAQINQMDADAGSSVVDEDILCKMRLF